MTGTIFAVFIFLLPGMDKPQTQRMPVSSYEECLQQIAKALEFVKGHDGKEQKVLVGCEITGVKSDPS